MECGLTILFCFFLSVRFVSVFLHLGQTIISCPNICKIYFLLTVLHIHFVFLFAWICTRIWIVLLPLIYSRPCISAFPLSISLLPHIHFRPCIQAFSFVYFPPTTHTLSTMHKCISYCLFPPFSPSFSVFLSHTRISQEQGYGGYGAELGFVCVHIWVCCSVRT